jgi:WD40 repeat protein
MLIDAWRHQGFTPSRPARVELGDKRHSLRLEYCQLDGARGLELRWEREDGTEEIIPGEFLSCDSNKAEQLRREPPPSLPEQAILVLAQPSRTTAVFPGGKLLVTLGDNGKLHQWAIKDGQEGAGFEDVPGSLAALDISQDGRRLVTGDDNGVVRLWDVAERRLLRSWEGHKGPVRTVQFISRDTRALSAGNDGTVVLWDPSADKELSRFPGIGQGPASFFAGSEEGQTVLSGGPNLPLRLWQFGAAEGVEMQPARDFSCLAVSPDGNLAAWDSGDADGAGIVLWDVKDRKELRRLKGHLRNATALAFTPDGRRLLSGGWDTALRLWDVSSGKEERVVRGHLRQVTTVTVSPDGKYAASTSNDQTVRVWELPPPG